MDTASTRPTAARPHPPVPLRQFRLPLRLAALGVLLLALIPVQASALRFVTMGDSRGYTVDAPLNTAVLAQVNQRIKALSPAPEFLVFLGDLSYRANIPVDGHDHYTYKTWLDFMRAPSTGLPASLPLYMVIGNHELYDEGLAPHAEASITLACQQAYQNFIQTNASSTFMPNVTSLNDNYKNLAYSFTSEDGKSLFVVLDGFYIATGPTQPYDGAGALNQTQRDYLQTTLSQSSAKTKFVFVHNPAFGPSTQPTTACVASSMCEFWKIVNDNKATAVFNGHDHLFSRVLVNSGFNGANPGYSFTKSIPQVIAGTCGAPISGTYDEPGKPPLAASWNGKLQFNYSVVDVDDSGPQAKVTINSYCGDGSGSWSLCDRYTNAPVTVAPADSLLLRSGGQGQ
ncbi:metallophosphoesterase family protein [Fundidesulfovibrio soli]|uniref:metallophosphoesterase family protein n=1 Tax=Fundidesulfovibrio soli TaxID=2922716 RepID=UPI001FB01B7D|nr:metallophosphoesterase [Fundidesulfovibrio soli]